jgi:hypothetical protein
VAGRKGQAVQSTFDVQAPALPLEAPHKTLGKKYYGHRLAGTELVIYTREPTDHVPAGRYSLTPIRAHATRTHGLVVNDPVTHRVTAQLEVLDADTFELPFGRIGLWSVVTPVRRSSLPTHKVVTIHDQGPPIRVVTRPARYEGHAVDQLARRLRVPHRQAGELLDQFLHSSGIATPAEIAMSDVKPPAVALWVVEYFGSTVKLYATADGTVLTAAVDHPDMPWANSSGPSLTRAGD